MTQNTDWKNIEGLKNYVGKVVLLNHDGEITTSEEYEDTANKKWMPYELAIKKLNAPLLEWIPISKWRYDNKYYYLFSKYGETYLGDWDAGADHFLKIPIPPQPELKLYVGMYGKCRGKEIKRIILGHDSCWEDENEEQYNNYGKCIRMMDCCSGYMGDIIAEATEEEYVAYVTREL